MNMLFPTMGLANLGLWSYDALDGLENWILWFCIYPWN